MTIAFFGYLKPTTNFPAFAIPVFKDQAQDDYFAQVINDEGKVEDLLPLASSDVADIKPWDQENSGEQNEIGSDGMFGFLMSSDQGLFSKRHLVEEYIEENLETIQSFPATSLMALRFIGCSRAEERAAVGRLAGIIRNDTVSQKFSEIELLMIPDDELVRKIDDLILNLADSSNFEKTHNIVSSIWSKREHLTLAQCKTALRACLQNNQVYQIAADDDVRILIGFLISNGKIKLTESAKHKLQI
jgi:hypothetical protein